MTVSVRVPATMEAGYGEQPRVIVHVQWAVATRGGCIHVANLDFSARTQSASRLENSVYHIEIPKISHVGLCADDC